MIESVAQVIAILCFVPLHELGHCLIPLSCGWNPKLVRKGLDFGIKYACDNEGNEFKMCLSAFAGIIGIIPIVVMFYCYQTFASLFLLVFLTGYSFYELLRRIRYCRRDKK